MITTMTKLLLSALSCAAAEGQWVNSLKPQGTPAGNVALVKNAKPAGSILIPAQATGPEKKAAEDLQHWIYQITKAKLDIVAQDQADVRVVIRTDPTLGAEGYEIAIDQNRLLLSGGHKRGAINSVYALLEEDLGCRFYTRESIRLPRTDTLVVIPVSRRSIPKLDIRDPYYKCAFDGEWSLRNRTNSPAAAVPEEYGGNVDYANMFVHTAAQILPADRYFAEHPEYFAQAPDGKRHTAQFCSTEPAVVQIAIEYVLKVLKENPHTEILSVSKNDNTQVCNCTRCTQLRTDEGSDIANQLFLVNQVAKAVEELYPDKVIDTLAYLETIQVPKTVRPRKNVAIRLCNDSVGSWSRPFVPAEKCAVAELVQAWSKVHDRISIWDYNVNFSHYLAPMPNIDIIASNIRFWVNNHAHGIMLQGGYQGPAEQDELKCWVASKLLWDPARDEKDLCRDFIWGHYGKAAPAIAEYDALLYRSRDEHAEAMATPSGGIRYGMDAPMLNKDFLDKATKLFAQARTLAADDAALLRRVERAELPILYVKCVRGPEFVGQEYAAVVAEFERIARREEIKFLQEGDTDFEAKLAGYKKNIAPPPTQP